MAKAQAKFKIESGVPRNSGGVIRGQWREVYAKMQVGDSFLCSATEYRSQQQASVRIGAKISGRKQPDGRYRVWLLVAPRVEG